MKYKVAICVRTDIKMSAAKLAVQVAHACERNILNRTVYILESGDGEEEYILNEYAKEGYPKVVLKVPDQATIGKLANKARDLGISSFIVTEFGLTEIEPDIVTCIAIGPMDQETSKKITGGLELYDL